MKSFLLVVLLSILPTSTYAKTATCFFENGDRRMTPKFKKNGTWTTPKQKGTYKLLSNGRVQFQLDTRKLVIGTDGKISGGGSTDKECTMRIHSLK